MSFGVFHIIVKSSRPFLKVILFKTFDNPFEGSYEDSERILQLKLTYLHCSDELRCKFKEGDLGNFSKCVPKDEDFNF
jgi:hypothetical protein